MIQAEFGRVLVNAHLCVHNFRFCKVRTKLRKLVNELGYLDGFLYLCSNTLRSICERELIFKYYLVIQPVKQQNLLPERRSKNYTVREILSADAVLDAFPRPTGVLRKRFRSGATCFAVFHKGELEGFMWLNRKQYNEDEVKCLYRLHPETGMVWDYDVYIFPKNRLSFAFPKLWQDVNHYLFENGYRWTASRISAFNPESIRAHKRLGGEITGSALFLLAGGLQVMLSTFYPYIHVSLRGTGVPAIDVHAPR